MCKTVFISLFFSFVAGPWTITAQHYKSTAAEVSFYSSAPIEDIEAHSKSGVSILNTGTGEIYFRVDIKDFQFRKSKMQEHFNENFMESDRYPHATFKGNIQEQIDFSQNGSFPVMLLGVLSVHGKQKNRKVPSQITVKDGEIHLKSRFKVACEDHDIKIPRILWQNIAEVVEVKVAANYSKMK